MKDDAGARLLVFRLPVEAPAPAPVESGIEEFLLADAGEDGLPLGCGAPSPPLAVVAGEPTSSLLKPPLRLRRGLYTGRSTLGGSIPLPEVDSGAGARGAASGPALSGPSEEEPGR